MTCWRRNHLSWLGGDVVRALVAGGYLLMGGSAALALLSGDRAVWVRGFLPDAAAQVLLVTGCALLAVAMYVVLPRRGCIAAVAAGGALLLGAIWDTVTYYVMLADGSPHAGSPLPLSLFLAAAFAVGLVLIRRAETPAKPQARPLHRGRVIAGWSFRAAGWGAGVATLLLAHLLFFGWTDYRRPADCAIVLGSKVYADGRCSLALYDRVMEGVRLYHNGYVSRLIMTGGIDPNGRSEPVAMRALAMQHGVPADAIICDEQGINTRASARHCAALMRQHRLRCALIVSHYYHLARCKRAFERHGIQAYTVPARMTRRLLREPYFVLRECAAYGVYLLPTGRQI